MADKIAMDAAYEGVPIVAVYPGVLYGPGKVTAGNVVANLVHFFSGNLGIIFLARIEYFIDIALLFGS